MAALFPVLSSSFLKDPCGDFPGGPVVKNPPSIAEDAGYAKAETPILWPPDAKSQLIGKYPDAGKD